ncbi:MAG: hypothetical protein WBM43_12465, partial [Flavobacteriaceae bacterium]
IEVTDAGGTISQDLDGTFATDAELAALSVNDADADPLNEIQNITSVDASVVITSSGNDFDLSVSGVNDNQNLTGASLSGTDLTINIENGSAAVADLSSLATDAELAALSVDDADADPNNELQTLSKAGTTITLSNGGGSVSETNTSLAQNTTTGVITYTNEAAANQTANVVSTDANNSISVGSDGGAYYGAYEKIVIWAEENGSLANNQLEWSFGNGATGQIGIPLPEAWEAYAVSFNADANGGSDTVTMAVTDSNTNTNLFTFTASGNANNMVYTQILASPVAIPAGTSIGFRTVTESGNVSDARVAVFLRRRP